MTLDRRMTLTAGIAVVLASTVIFPLFSGSVWFAAGIGAVVTVAAAGTLSRIRTLPVLVCLAITLVALLLYLNLVFEHSRSYIEIIPSPSSLAALARLVGDGVDSTRKYAPGAPTVPPLVLLAAGGIGLTAVFTDLIAVRLRSTALAGLPLLVLFTVPVTMNATRSQLATGLIFILGTSGYLAMLSVDGRERIRLWGRLISLWRSQEAELKEYGADDATGSGGPGRARHTGRADANGDESAARSPYRVLRGPDTRGLAAAGRRVGVFSIIAALFVPVLVPGLHAGRLLDSAWGIGNGNGSGTLSIPDPLAATTTDLKATKTTTVLTYSTTATDRPYLQQYVSYTLTDSTTDPWLPFSSATTIQPFNDTLPTEPGLKVHYPEITDSIHILPSGVNPGTGVNFLPAPYPPIAVQGESGSWGVDPSTLMLVTKNGTLASQNYQVTSSDPDPTGQQLNAVPASVPDVADIQLPADYSQQALKQIALAHTAGAKTPYEKANDLALWLGQYGGFGYTTAAQPITSGTSLLQFLTTAKSGDCVQFSFAFTVLARLLGIPAREATGFTSGSPQGNHWAVKNTDAHAWPEVYFSGYGWIRFEPTPDGQGTASAPGYNKQPGAVGNGVAPPLTGPTANPTAGAGQGGKSNPKVKNLNPEDGDGSSTAVKLSADTPWTAILLAVLAAIALAGGVIALAMPAARSLTARPDAPRPRRGISFTVALAAIVAAGVVAIALYRLMSKTTGLNLGTGWATVGIAYGAAAAFALAVPTALRAVLRRWRWMRASDDASRAHAAWHELCADLADSGIGCRPSESPRALAGRMATSLTLSETAVAAVNRIALAEERATYAASPSSTETLRRDGVLARRGIASAVGRGARWRARVFPASVVSTLADAMMRVTESGASRLRPRWGGRRLES